MTCSSCGAELRIGTYPFCPHGEPARYQPFKPFYDISLGSDVTSLAQWNRVMREKHADLKDHPTAGDMSARRDKIRERERARA